MAKIIAKRNFFKYRDDQKGTGKVLYGNINIMNQISIDKQF